MADSDDFGLVSRSPSVLGFSDNVDVFALLSRTAAVLAPSEGISGVTDEFPLLSYSAQVLAPIDYDDQPPPTPAPDELLTDLTAALYAGNTLIAEIPASRVRSKDEHNGVGYGDVDVLFDDPVVPQLTMGRRIRFHLKGVHAFTAIIEDQDKIQASSDEEAGAKITVGGRGVASRLDEGCLLPWGGIGSRPFGDTRAFSWASPEYDCSAWPTVWVQYNQAHRMLTDGILGNGDEDWVWWDDHGDPQFYEPWWPSRGWPTQSNKWMWTVNRGVWFFPGKYLFAKNVYIPTDRLVTQFMISSRRARVFVDGLLGADWPVQPPIDKRLDVQYLTTPMTAGWHKIGIEAEIWGEPPYPYYGTIAWCMHTENANGVYDNSTLLAVSDETWRCRDFPYIYNPEVIYPAPSPHTIMQTVLSESQAEGMCSGITLSSTAATTSGGRPWNPPAEQVFQVGQSPLSILQALDVDWAMSPSGDVLHLWNPGERGSEVTSALIEVGSNAGSLRRRRTA